MCIYIIYSYYSLDHSLSFKLFIFILATSSDLPPFLCFFFCIATSFAHYKCVTFFPVMLCPCTYNVHLPYMCVCIYIYNIIFPFFLSLLTHVCGVVGDLCVLGWLFSFLFGFCWLNLKLHSLLSFSLSLSPWKPTTTITAVAVPPSLMYHSLSPYYWHCRVGNDWNCFRYCCWLRDAVGTINRSSSAVSIVEAKLC